ncbi:Uncharacterised protein [Mycobacterium tuberculosis]|nr:Uncharacterised protein [Mycobacterium tuberculosis]
MMPSANRALTRAARRRAKTEGVPYTQARDTELAIRERMDADGESYAEAEAFVTDPRNEVLCEKCGWTVAMVCPECPGCGCYNHQCTGWRHREYMHPDDLAELEAAEAECPECGGDTRTGYDCDCDDYRAAGGGQDHADDDEDRRADDALQAWKDDLAMGYIDRDGNQLDPPEPDYAEYESAAEQEAR